MRVLADQLEEERARLAAVESVARIGSWETDLADFSVRWSEQTHRIFETDPAAFRPTHESFLEMVHPDDRAAVDAAFAASLKDVEPHAFEHRIVMTDGRVKRVEERWRVFADAAGRGLKAVGTCQEVTERRRTEDLLRESEAKFSLLFHSSPAKIAIGTMDGRLVDVNRAYAEFFGFAREEMLGRTIAELGLISADELRRLLAMGRGPGVAMRHVEVAMRARDGRPLQVLMSADILTLGGVPHRVATLMDITALRQAEDERRTLQTRALRAQRLEALGTLAGGIAHDLNNNLSPIMMSLHMLRERAAEAETADLLRSLEDHVRRAADMVRQVLLFARGADGRRVPVDLRSVARDVERIARDTFPKSISCGLETGSGPAAILGNPTQLHQVLLNLCVNARDAMPDGGRLTISLEATRLSGPEADRLPHGRPGDFLRLTVADTGTGIPSDIKERIFEPFFTTKEVGRGTGLGLSTSLAIVRSHGGFISVDSELGSGSRFHVHLPATAAEAPCVAGPAEPPPRGRGELVPVVDDEASIRDVARRTLEGAGYRVLLASDGREAVAVFARHREAVAAVLTDMAMPLMDGRALVASLRSLSPRLPVIGMSGKDEAADLARSAGAQPASFLAKPYSGDDLLRTVRRALDEARDA